MPVAGTLVAESVRPGGLVTLEVTLRRMVRRRVSFPSPDQPDVWTFIDFRCADEQQAEALAQRLSQAMLEGPWYCDYGSQTRKWIVFAGKVFAFARDDEASWSAAVAHGRAVGVPEAQLDWVR